MHGIQLYERCTFYYSNMKETADMVAQVTFTNNSLISISEFVDLLKSPVRVAGAVLISNYNCSLENSSIHANVSIGDFDMNATTWGMLYTCIILLCLHIGIQLNSIFFSQAHLM